MEKIKEKARMMTNDQINESLAILGGGFLATFEERMARAAILDIYAERFGVDAMDAKMEEMGL